MSYGLNLRQRFTEGEDRSRRYEDNEHAQPAATDEHVRQAHPQDSPTPATKHKYYYQLCFSVFLFLVKVI